jgi:hypothetical protein
MQTRIENELREIRRRGFLVRGFPFLTSLQIEKPPLFPCGRGGVCVLTYREAQDRHPVLPETGTPSPAEGEKDCYFSSRFLSRFHPCFPVFVTVAPVSGCCGLYLAVIVTVW